MTQGINPRTPVVIGVGQLLDRTGAAPEPAELAAQAAEAAARDTGAAGVLTSIDTVATVQIAGWRYSDAAAVVASHIGATPALTMYPTHGGNSPQMLMNRLGDRIASGESDLALLCGAESFRTSTAIRRTGAKPDWPSQPDATPGWTDDDVELFHPVELEHRLVSFPAIYAIFEHALRSEAGRSHEEHTAFLGELWAGFSAVAARNPYAWDRAAHSATDITTVTDTNWMVADPYTLHMVSNPRVDMSSAAIVCAAETAESLGVPRDNWVFLLAGTDAKDPLLSHRPSLTTSEAMRNGGRGVLELAGTHVDDVAHLDIYSCFPSAVELACKEIGISLSRQLTVYGGLGFAGGPWNNPVGHAIASMVDMLRNDQGSQGLVTANGGVVMKHSFGVYSTTPPTSPFRTASYRPATDNLVEVVTDHTGAATLEGWTVEYGKDRTPERGIAAFRTPDGARGWATTTDAAAMEVLETTAEAGDDVEVDNEAQLRLGASAA